MGRIATPDATSFLGTDRTRRLLDALFGVAPAQVCLPDDMNPARFHILQGSKEGLACFTRRQEAMRRDLQAMATACEVAGRAVAQEKARGDRFETALRQEQERSRVAEAQIQSWMGV